ncbi:hypothetical protein FRC04_008578 [Tulasnella sp. 424]|nr:hypothetical protein FRC04_008578 [Tulasnella sp. 424]KAG8974049.1 hypothetical protein FRC05_007965 [Tulasnella sp. 425]
MKALTNTLKLRVDAFIGETRLLEAPNGGDEDEISLCDALEILVRHRRNKRLLFSRLPTDVIHSVFTSALDIDRIHEPDLPLEVLEDHQKQLFRMRSVCVAWNEFLVSGPRYWLAVNLRTPPEVLQITLKRAEQAPLCVYSTTSKESRARAEPPCNEDHTVLAGSMVYVRTIRSDHRGFLPLWKKLLQSSMTSLETLDLAANVDWASMDSEHVAGWLSDSLPVVRDVTARGWQPLSSATWLENLRSLSLCRPMKIETNMLRILSQCCNLLSLKVETDGIASDEESESMESPPKIALPHLRKLELELGLLQEVRHLVLSLDIPPHAQGSLRIMSSSRSEEFVEDLAHFIFPDGTESKPPTNPLLEIHTPPDYPEPVTYTAGNRSIKFGIPERTEEWDPFSNIIVVLQNRLNNPPLTVQLDRPTERHATTLRRLGNLNVQKIHVKDPEKHLDKVLAAIGSRHPNLPSGTVPDGHNWPFESLRECVIEQAGLSLAQLARLVGIRQRYLRTSSKEWLKRITLVACNIWGGLSLSAATWQLGAIGVTLVADDRCRFAR